MVVVVVGGGCWGVRFKRLGLGFRCLGFFGFRF